MHALLFAVLIYLCTTFAILMGCCSKKKKKNGSQDEDVAADSGAVLNPSNKQNGPIEQLKPMQRMASSAAGTTATMKKGGRPRSPLHPVNQASTKSNLNSTIKCTIEPTEKSTMMLPTEKSTMKTSRQQDKESTRTGATIIQQQEDPKAKKKKKKGKKSTDRSKTAKPSTAISAQSALTQQSQKSALIVGKEEPTKSDVGGTKSGMKMTALEAPPPRKDLRTALSVSTTPPGSSTSTSATKTRSTTRTSVLTTTTTTSGRNGGDTTVTDTASHPYTAD